MLALILCYTMISAITVKGNGQIHGVGNKVSNSGTSINDNGQAAVQNTDNGEGNVNDNGQNVVNRSSVTPSNSGAASQGNNLGFHILTLTSMIMVNK